MTNDTQVAERIIQLIDSHQQEGDARKAFKPILAEFVVIPRSELPSSEQIIVPDTADPDTLRRNARRDELVVDLSAELYPNGARLTYAGAITTVQRAIDRIIELEEAAS